MQTGLILSNIHKHITLEHGESEFFLSLFESRQLEKNEYLLEAGKPCTKFNYVISGTLRAFHRDADGKDSTIMFAIADWWITDMPCFVSQSPAMISIEAIEASSVLQLSKENMELLYVRIPKFERFFRILMQNAYVREQLRILQNLSQPAEERYTSFLKKYPTIASKVTQKNIASYLGITPEFLSVIRNKMRKGDLS